MAKPFELNMSKIPHELTVILALMQAGSTSVERCQIEPKLASVDWDQFMELTLHHRVYPSVYKQLKQLNSDHVPERVMKTLAGLYQHNTFEMLRLSGEMEQICRRLREADIDVLLLKGPVLAAELYGDIALRTSVDLDMMVDWRQLGRVEEILIGQGYVKDDYIKTVLGDWKWRHHHVTFTHPHKRTKLEIHWRLNPSPGKEPSFRALWESKRISALTGGPVYSLGTEMLFIFLVMHGARHGWSRLRWLMDIHQLVTHQSIHWPKLIRLLRTYHYTHVAGQALLLASSLLGTEIPETMLSYVHKNRPRKLAQGAVFYLQEMVRLHSPPLPKHVSVYHKKHLFALMSWQQKLLFLLSFLYPYPEDADVLPLPDKWHFLYFPLRPVLWVWRHVKRQPV